MSSSGRESSRVSSGYGFYLRPVMSALFIFAISGICVTVIDAKKNELGADTCIFDDQNGSGLRLNLTALSGVNIFGGTSTYSTYYYSPCANAYECTPPGERHNTDAMINQVSEDTGDCQFLAVWDDSDTQPVYFPSAQTWEFQYFNGYDCGGNMMRIWWVCNESVNYNIIFSGAEADCMYGFYVESRYACTQQQRQ